MGIDGNYGFDDLKILNVQLEEKVEKKDKLEDKKIHYTEILKNSSKEINTGNAVTGLAKKVCNYFTTLTLKFELIFINRSLKSLDNDIKYLTDQGATIEGNKGPAKVNDKGKWEGSGKDF